MNNIAYVLFYTIFRMLLNLFIDSFPYITKYFCKFENLQALAKFSKIFYES